MKKTLLTLATMGLIGLVGCGGSDTPVPTPDAGTPDAGVAGFPQPAGTVAVNFTADDSANKIYVQGDLEWKGAMIYDPTTRIISKDSTWNGPFAKLYDDGPWTAGGHEPDGATAGDHKWGITIFATPPATGSDTYSYGLNDAKACTTDPTIVGCNGWSWLGSNGSFSVAAGATNPVNATGRSFAKFGTTDLQFTATKASLLSLCQLSAPATCAATADCADPNQACNGTSKKCQLIKTSSCTAAGNECAATSKPTTCTPPNTTLATIKSSGWGWSEVKTVDDGAGHLTFTVSANVGTGNKLPHAGLFNSGDKPEFLFVFNGVEYRDQTQTTGPASTTGITAGTKATGASTYTPATVGVLTTGNIGNTYVTIP